MATPVFCCGFECGVSLVGTHWPAFSAGGGVAFDTTAGKIRTGSRSLLFSPSAVVAAAGSPTFTAGTRFVIRAYIRFTSLPSADVYLIRLGSAAGGPALRFKQSDSKIYASVGTTLGATGVTVTTGQWYRLDCDFNVSTGGNDTSDVQVDGTACGQATAAGFSTTQSEFRLGHDASWTANLNFDDVVCSQTGADYPIGAGHVDHFVPTADGTHNVASADDFERTLTGTDITNATTTAFQLLDDVPLETSATDFINMVAPPNATDYVECVFGPAPGISTPTAGPRAVEVIAAVHQAGTQTGNYEIRMNDNGTLDAMVSVTGGTGTTTLAYKRKHYAANLANGGAWTAASGAGNFNNLRVRFGSPAALDVNPDQFLDCVMVEAEFADVAGNQTVTPGNASLTLSTFAPQLKQTITPPSQSLALTRFAPTASQGKTVTPPNASLTLSRFAPQLQTKLTPATRSLALTTFAPLARVNQILTVGAASLSLTRFAPRLVQTITPASRTMTLVTFTPQLQQRITPGSRTLTLTTFAPRTGLGVMPGSRSVVLTTFAPAIRQAAAVVPGSASLTLTRFAPILQTTLTPNARTLTLTRFAPVLAQRVTPDARAMALTTFAPSVSQRAAVTPATATLTLTRLAPVVRLTVTPASRALSLSTFPPQLRAVVTPDSRALVLTRFAPSLDNNVTVIPASASLTLTRFAPSVLNPVTVTPLSRVLVLTTFAPQLQRQITPAPATLITTTFAPVLNKAVIPAPGALLLTTFAPQLRTHITITGRTLTFTTFAPNVIGGISSVPARTYNTTRGVTSGGSQSNVRIFSGRTGARVKDGR